MQSSTLLYQSMITFYYSEVYTVYTVQYNLILHTTILCSVFYNNIVQYYSEISSME